MLVRKYLEIAVDKLCVSWKTRNIILDLDLWSFEQKVIHD